MKGLGSFAVSLLITLSLGFATSYFIAAPIESWYSTLVKPLFTPPSWVFGTVWTFLYILMALGAARVWDRRNERPRVGKQALSLYIYQLILNTLWSIFFFVAQNPILAFVDILALLALIVSTAFVFFRVDRAAGWLFVPYVLWVSFATYLNLGIIMLN